MTIKGLFLNGPFYGANEFADFFTNFLRTGYFENLEVTANDSMTTTLKAGSAFIEGFNAVVTADVQSVHETADATNNRIDRIVLRLDRTQDSANAIQRIVRKGLASTSPVAPSLIRNEDIHEISLAQVLINAGSSVIASGQITDERNVMSVCGPSIPNGQLMEDNQLDSSADLYQYPHGLSTMRIKDSFGSFPTIAGQIQTNRASADVAAQFYFSSLIDRPYLYVRTTYLGAWTPWQRIDAKANVRGNGDLLTEGSVSVTSAGNTTTSVNITFDKAFTTIPRVWPGVNTSTPNKRTASVGGVTQTGFILYVYDEFAGPNTIPCTWLAKGGTDE